MHLTEHQLRKQIRSVLRELLGRKSKQGGALKRGLGGTGGGGGGYGGYTQDDANYDLAALGYGGTGTGFDDGDHGDDGDIDVGGDFDGDDGDD